MQVYCNSMILLGPVRNRISPPVVGTGTGIGTTSAIRDRDHALSLEPVPELVPEPVKLDYEHNFVLTLPWQVNIIAASD